MADDNLLSDFDSAFGIDPTFGDDPQMYVQEDALVFVSDANVNLFAETLRIKDDFSTYEKIDTLDFINYKVELYSIPSDGSGFRFWAMVRYTYYQAPPLFARYGVDVKTLLEELCEIFQGQYAIENRRRINRIMSENYK